MNVVVDANVVIKWYVEELDSTSAQVVFEEDGILIAPGHILGEVGEVLIRRLREGKITREQVNIAQIAIPGTLLLVSLDELFSSAVEVALQTQLSFYDSLYIAAAVRWETVVVTADQRLIKSVAGSAWANHVAALTAWSTKHKH